MHPRLVALLDLLPDTKARYESSLSRYAELRARSERDTARDAWYDGSHHAPAPLGLERMGLAPGRALRAAPRGDARANTCRYGLAQDGRICVEQQFTEFPDRAYEEFWSHAADRIHTVRYDHYEPDKDLINVQIVLLERGSATALIRHAQRGIAIEAYEYDERGRLCRVHAAAREHDSASPQHAWMNTRDDVYYDAHGGLLRIDRTWIGGPSETIYPDPHG